MLSAANSDGCEEFVHRNNRRNEENDLRVVRFEPDGKSILVRRRGVPAKIERVFLNSGQREQVRQISPSDPAGVQTITNVRFSADGKSYAYSYFRTLSDLWVVDGLK